MIEFFIAKKQMLDRKKQSLISILGIMIGVTVLTVSIGISNGLDKNMIQGVLSINSHILYQPSSPIENYKELKDEIEKIPGVKGVVSSIPIQGIIKYQNENREYIAGVKIQGFDLESTITAMDLDKKILLGEIDTKPNTVLIGEELAVNLGAFVGDTVTLISPDGKEIRLVVSGIFRTGYYDYDLNVIMINLKTAQYMSYLGEATSEFNIILDDPYDADKISKELFKKHGITTRTWGELNRNLLSALSLEKTVMIIVFSLIIVIAGFVVWSTLNMIVREKIKDIGILRAMGFPKQSIMRIYLMQGLSLGSIGIFLGIIISLGILWYIKNYSIPGVSSIYYIQKVPIEISIKEIIVIIFSNFAILFLSSILPAYRAASLETQEALKYE
ncbi:MAG: FtsX-like permease family protein [Fusobacteriaceae bacterium]